MDCRTESCRGKLPSIPRSAMGSGMAPATVKTSHKVLPESVAQQIYNPPLLSFHKFRNPLQQILNVKGLSPAREFGRKRWHVLGRPPVLSRVMGWSRRVSACVVSDLPHDLWFRHVHAVCKYDSGCRSVTKVTSRSPIPGFDSPNGS